MSTSPPKAPVDDEDDFISLAVSRTTAFAPRVIFLSTPRSEDMRVVADAEIQARPNTVATVDIKRRVIRFS